MKNNWGGSRTGSGRKQLSEEEKLSGYTLQLSQQDVAYIDSLEGNSRSDKLRRFIKEHKS